MSTTDTQFELEMDDEYCIMTTNEVNFGLRMLDEILYMSPIAASSSKRRFEEVTGVENAEQPTKHAKKP